MPDIWYEVRKKVGDIRATLPPGVVGPGFNDEFGDIFGIIYGFTADGFTHRELRDYVEDVRSRLLQVPDVSKIEIIGAQDEQIFVEFSTEQLAGLGLDHPALLAALQAQNAVRPAGVVQTGDERLVAAGLGRLPIPSRTSWTSTSSVGDRIVRLGDIAEVRRGYADPPQPMFRVNGQPAIGLAHRDARRRRHPGARPEHRAGDGRDPGRPADRHRAAPGRRPGGDGRALAINEFMNSLWQAIAIILAVELHQPRRAARARWSRCRSR